MARCQVCTAPLPPRSSVCRYCGRRSDVDLKGVHEFTVAVPTSTRTCPACEIPMQTLDLHLGGTFYIERCERCLSLFFDPNEVETLLEKSTSDVFQIDYRRLDEATRARGAAPEKIRYYRCPVCRTAMNRRNFGSRSGVIVDQCPDHGIWLEAGELRRLLEWKKAGGQVLDRRRRKERERERRTEDSRRAAAALGAGGIAFPGQDADPFRPRDATDVVNSAVRALARLFR